MSPEIAVVGGGMFGVTAAVELAETVFDVTLYEKKEDILIGASGSNHWRLHRGYHYPQSDKTARKALETEPLFRSRYNEAVIEDEDHYYAVAEDSWVSFSEYREFMDSHGLEYELAELDLVDDDQVEQTLLVNENHVSPTKLRELCWEELEAHQVSVQLETEVESLDDLREYDHVVIATYANMNAILPEGHALRQPYKFEVCEVPIVDLPETYIGNNIIVVYGPFMSTDHWGETNYFAMGDYHHMRHHTSTGYEPEIPDEFQHVINTGIVKDPSLTNFDKFREHGEKYIPGVAEGRHVGSLFTVRTILPDVEETDARPTLVNQKGDIITVFGGKLATSVFTAKEVVEIAEKRWTGST